MRARLASVARLGLPLQNLGAAWASAGVAMLAYALTMADDLTFYDSAELALVAHQLGLGHPIGQPLHTWIGHLFAHLPGVSPLVGLTLLSALAGALALIPACAIAERLAGEHARPLAIAPVLIAAALHPIAWEPATRVEVYTLATFLALWALARAMSERTRLWPVGLALGLAASANAVIALAFGVALAPRLFRLAERPRARALGGLLVAGLAGLVPYVHIALVAADRTRFVWGAPEDRESLIAYLSGADYAHNAGIDAQTFLDHLLDLARQGLAEASLPIALVGIGAHLVLGRRLVGVRFGAMIVAGLCLAFVARNVVFHPDVPDYRGYLLPAWLAAAAGVAATASVLVARGDRFRIYGAVVALLPLFSIALSPAHLGSRRDSPALGRALVRGALAEAPPDSVLIVEADHWVAPLLYAQEVEGARPDVVVLAHGLASSSWYWEHLFARHPTLSPMPLRGPGGRDGRIRRLLDANPARPVLVEHLGLALAIGREPCAVGWMIGTRGACMLSPTEASSAIGSAWTERGEASEVAARVGMARGEALFRLGRGQDAYDALVAGQDAPRLTLPERAPPLRGPLPAWSRRAALHDPARNLFVAALLLDAVGMRAESAALMQRAAALGLPEATPRATPD